MVGVVPEPHRLLVPIRMAVHAVEQYVASRSSPAAPMRSASRSSNSDRPDGVLHGQLDPGSVFHRRFHESRYLAVSAHLATFDARLTGVLRECCEVRLDGRRPPHHPLALGAHNRPAHAGCVVGELDLRLGRRARSAARPALPADRPSRGHRTGRVGIRRDERVPVRRGTPRTRVRLPHRAGLVRPRSAREAARRGTPAGHRRN